MTDNAYEVVPHLTKVAKLRSTDRSRFGVARLTVSRTRHETGIVSVIVRSVGGGLLRDTRIAAATIRIPNGSAVSEDPMEVLAAALAALQDARAPHS